MANKWLECQIAKTPFSMAQEILSYVHYICLIRFLSNTSTEIKKKIVNNIRERCEKLECHRTLQNGETEFCIHILVLEVGNNISDIFYFIKNIEFPSLTIFLQHYFQKSLSCIKSYALKAGTQTF